MGFRAKGFGLRVEGFGLRVKGVERLRFRAWESGDFGVGSFASLRFRLLGVGGASLGFRV